MEPEKINPRLGVHLRASREASGLTLKALADSMGVTPSLLSQIETGKVQPSLNTLYQLVGRLNLSVDSLLDGRDGQSENSDARDASGAAARPTMQRAGENPTLVLTTGVTWERLAGGLEETMEPLFITYPPHTKSSLTDGLSQYNGYEFGLLLEGRLSLKLGFDSYEMNAGDSVHFDAYPPHVYINESEEPARGVWFVLRDQLLRMRAQLGPMSPVFGSAGSATAPQSAWHTVDQTDW